MNSSEKPVVKIGALQYFGFESSEPDLGLVWQWATQIIIDAVNASPTLLPDVTLELILHDTEGDKFVAMGHSIDFVHEHHVAAIFGAMYSGISMPTSQYTGAYNLPQISAISGATDLSDKATYPTFMRTTTSSGPEESVLLALFLKQHGWDAVSVVFDDDDYAMNIAKNRVQELATAGIKILSQSSFEYSNTYALMYPLEKFDSSLDIIESVGSRVHIAVTQSYFMEQLMVQASRRSNWNPEEHIWILLNGWGHPDLTTIEQHHDFYQDPPSPEYIEATQGAFYLNTGSGKIGDSWKDLLNAVHDRSQEEEMPRCDLGNAQPVSDALYTIAHAMHKLHKRGELLIPESDGDTCMNITAYKHRNELLHEEMLASDFESILEGVDVKYTDTGDVFSNYAMYQIEKGMVQPRDTTEWNPCEGEREVYQPMVVARSRTGCMDSSCVQQVAMPNTWSFMDGTTTPPPAVGAATVVTTGMNKGLLLGIVGGVVVVCLLVVQALRAQSKRNLAKVENMNSALVVERQNDQAKISSLELRLHSAVKYSRAEVDLLKKKLAEFDDLNVDNLTDVNKNSDNQLGQTAANVRRGSVDGSTRAINSIRVPSDEVTMGTLLGKGGFGEVYSGTFRGQEVAIKTLKVVDEENLERFKLEILMMHALHHTNICFLVSVCWDEGMIGLLMELSDVGPLSDVMATKSEGFTWKEPMHKYLTDVGYGLQYLHQVKWYDANTKQVQTSIIHRDIKPDNVLVFKPDTCKLTDFGESRAIDLDQTMTQVGTALYCAPEITRGDRYTLKADVYSYGMLVLAMALRDKSLANFLRQDFASSKKRTMKMTTVGLVSHAMIGGWRPARPDALEIPDSIWHLHELCCDNDVVERPTFANIVEHLQEVAKPEIFEDKKAVLGGSDGLMSKRSGTQKKVGQLFKVGKSLSKAFAGSEGKSDLDLIIGLINERDREKLQELVYANLELDNIGE